MKILNDYNMDEIMMTQLIVKLISLPSIHVLIKQGMPL